MKSKGFLNRKVQLAFGSAILTLLVVGEISYRGMVMSDESIRWVGHTQEVLANLEDLLFAMERIESSYRGFALNGQESSLESYRASILSARKHEAAIRNLTVDNPAQKRRIPDLERLVDQKIEFAETIIALRRTKGLEAAANVSQTGRGRRIMEELHSVARAAQDEELRLLALRNADAEARAAQTRIVLILGTLTGVLITATAGWSALRDSSRGALAVQALRSSEEKYRGLLEAAPDAMVVIDPGGRIVLLNLQAERQFGYRRDELVGKKVDTIIPEGFAERLIADALRSAEAALAQQIGMGIELTGRRKNGSDFPIEIMLSPLESAKETLVTAAIRDISVRKRAEETLRKSEERFRLIAETIDEVFWIADSHFAEIFYVSPAYERVWGRTRASLYENPRSFLEPVHPKDIERTLLRFEIMKSGKVFDHEYRILRPDGVIVWVWNHGFPIHNEKGEVLRYVGVALDITERKQAEETLRESEERFRQIAETIDEVFWSSDPQVTKITYINSGYERVWGRTQASLYESPLSFIEAVHFEDRERVSRELEIMKSGQTFEHEFRIVRPDGNIRSIWNRGFPIHKETGEVVRYVGVAQDITQRKRAEAEHFRLLTAIEQAAESVVVTDAEGGIEYVNPAFSTMTGYSREEVLGKNPRILKSGKHDAAHYADMWAALLAGQVWKGEMINRRKDGSLYTERMSITPVHDGHGKITHMVAMKEDITAGRLLEDQFRQSQKMEAVGRLAAGVAHDFNNLLTVIVGYSNIMLDGFACGDPMRGYTAEIKSAGEKAAGLTRQLLAFSRHQVLAPQVLDLNTLIANLTSLLHRLIGEDIDLIFKAGPYPATVKADPGLIEQVLMNLAVNSRDAMPQGGKLTIETSPVQVDEAHSTPRFSIPVGPYVMLAVSDTGCGMDKDIQAHIFEPFFTTKEMGKGTGLGLATVYGIVKQSGGNIWVYSEVGAGTTFEIYLPAVAGAPEAPEERVVVAGGSETVLVVEDDAGLRELARMVLVDRGGYRVLASTGGKEARLFAKQFKGTIHLLLADVVMPGMSGRELGEQLVTLRPDMKILYMSGYTDDTVVHHGVLEQRMAFLQKPFTAATLLRKVRNLLDSQP